MEKIRYPLDKKLLSIRKISNKLIEREGLSIPVDILTLVGKYAVVECDDIPFSDAICINVESNPLIIYNSNTMETRLRFTLAHELGHILIPWHTGVISCHTEDEISIGAYEYEELEKQANTFASELLMPTHWLVELINKNRISGLESIIDKICTKANVSFLACLYAVTDTLPEGYFVSIKRLIEGYIQKKSNKDNTIFHLYNRSDFSLEWLKINSINNGIIRKQSHIINWIDLGEGIQHYYIEQLLEKKTIKDIVRVFKTIFEDNKLSPANCLNTLCECLPEGYILKIKLKNSQYYNYIKTNNTFINPRLIEDSDIALVEWYDIYCINKDEYNNELFKIYLWKFESFSKVEDDLEDKRDSKTILRDIIDSNIYNEERVRMFSRINGIIGGLNSRVDQLSKELFYNALKQKFIGRDDLVLITENEDFDKFLRKKTIEIYLKK